jgi:hypothetical protein
MSAVRDRVPLRSGTLPHEIDLGRKVIFLGSSKAYVEGPSQVERIETHFSWVFLTDRYLYKLKKPGRGKGFDFTSPEHRHRNAEEEVHLNRRLARDVYVGVVPLTFSEGRGMAIGGRGKTADWLVEMIRLAAGGTLDRRLAEGTVSTPISRRLAAAWRDFSPPPRAHILSRVPRGHGDFRPEHIRARIAILCTSKSSRSATR